MSTWKVREVHRKSNQKQPGSSVMLWLISSKASAGLRLLWAAKHDIWEFYDSFCADPTVFVHFFILKWVFFSIYCPIIVIAWKIGPSIISWPAKHCDRFGGRGLRARLTAPQLTGLPKRTAIFRDRHDWSYKLHVLTPKRVEKNKPNGSCFCPPQILAETIW